MTQERPSGLQGRRILVLEDEYIVAADLAHVLEKAGAEVMGPVGTITEALALVETDGLPDGAVLDVNVGREKSYAVADKLIEYGVPFVFSTGYDAWVLPANYSDIPRCEKPLDPSGIVRILAKQLDG